MSLSGTKPNAYEVSLKQLLKTIEDSLERKRDDYKKFSEKDPWVKSLRLFPNTDDIKRCDLTANLGNDVFGAILTLQRKDQSYHAKYFATLDAINKMTAAGEDRINLEKEKLDLTKDL